MRDRDILSTAQSTVIILSWSQSNMQGTLSSISNFVRAAKMILTTSNLLKHLIWQHSNVKPKPNKDTGGWPLLPVKQLEPW